MTLLDSGRYPALMTLLGQLPNRGYLQESIPAAEFARIGLARLYKSLFTGVSYVEQPGKPQGFIFFYRGQPLYSRIDPDKAGPGNFLSDVGSLPPEARISSMRMTRVTLSAGYAFINGRELGEWATPTPQTVQEALARFSGGSTGALAWLGWPSQVAIYENGLLIHESEAPNLSFPGPLLQYEVSSNALADAEPLADLSILSAEGDVTLQVADAAPAPVAPPAATFAAQAAPVSPPAGPDQAAMWQLLEGMYNKKLGRAGNAALSNLRASTEHLPPSEQLEIIKANLRSSFGDKAVSYFEQRL